MNDLIEALRASVRQKSLVVPLNMNESNVESNTHEKQYVTDPTVSSDLLTSTVESTPESERVLTIASSEGRPACDVLIMTIGPRKESLPVKGKGNNPKKLKKSKKKQANIRSGDGVNSEGAVTAPTASADTSSPTLTDTTEYKSATTSLSETSSRNHSFTSARSTVSLSTTHDSSIEQTLQSTPTAATKHSKSGSCGSSSSFTTPQQPVLCNQHQVITTETHTPMCVKGDAKLSISSNKILSSEALNPDSSHVSCTDDVNFLSTPVASLREQEEWPALEHTKKPTSRIADGRCLAIATAPPVTGPGTSNGGKISNAIIPVLPLNMMPRPRNSYVVRNCRGEGFADNN